MTLKQIKLEYPNFWITKTNSSYGNYAVHLSPTVTKFFFKLKELVTFLDNYIKDNEPLDLDPDTCPNDGSSEMDSVFGGDY